MKLLGVNSDAKTTKGTKYGYLTGISISHLRSNQGLKSVLHAQWVALRLVCTLAVMVAVKMLKTHEEENHNG